VFIDSFVLRNPPTRTQSQNVGTNANIRSSLSLESLSSAKSRNMGAIIIKADDQSSKLLKALAEKLGGNVTQINEEQYEDLLLGSLMEKEKSGKNTSRAAIFKKLASR
jgi:hypothetical protein